MKKDTKRRVSLKEHVKGNLIYTSKTMKKKVKFKRTFSRNLGKELLKHNFKHI